MNTINQLVLRQKGRRFLPCAIASTTTDLSRRILESSDDSICLFLLLPLVSPLLTPCCSKRSDAIGLTISCRSFPTLWPPLIIYTIWAFGFDTSPRRGGRPSKWLRNSPYWKLFAAYYPQTFIRVRLSIRSPLFQFRANIYFSYTQDLPQAR